MNLADQSILNELVVESREHLASIEPDLLSLERGETVSKEAVNRIFRALHSIKGGFGFFGYEKIKSLGHVMENVMMGVRDGKTQITPPMVDALLLGIDKLRVMLDDVGRSEDSEIGPELAALEGFADLKVQPEAIKIPVRAPDTAYTLNTLPVSREALNSFVRTGRHLYVLGIDINADLTRKNRSPLDFFKELEKVGEFVDSWMDTSPISGLTDCLEKEIRLTVILASVLEPDLLAGGFDIDPNRVTSFHKDEIRKELSGEKNKQGQSAMTERPGAANAAKIADPDETIRVKVDLLNDLVNLAGELVLSRNQLMQRLKDTESQSLKTIVQNIDRVTSELQEGIRNTRMQPIGTLFAKFPRIIRELSKKLGKEMEVFVEGEGVELDKSIIEALTDPLTHIVRNCADHGIESPQQRAKNNKPAAGRITLRAYHEGGQVMIEVGDDGQGIKADRVREKALENGLIRRENAAGMSDTELFQFIFEPGFSTAEVVSDVSGRGVGLDVVKTNIEKLGGTVVIESVAGRGTTIKLTLPLTLAIIPSLIVTCEERRFAVPQVDLEELVRIRAVDVSRKIENIRGYEVLRLRDRLLPVVRLNKILDIPNPTFIDPETKERMPDRRKRLADRRQGEVPEIKEMRSAGKDRRCSSKSAANVLVLKVGPNRFGLVVESLHDNEEIVVKPLSMYLKGCKCYSGATIMGDGRVAMILDSAGISEEANLKFDELSKESQMQAEKHARDLDKASRAMLMFKSSATEVLCMEISGIARIEKVGNADIEKVGDKEYVRHADSSLRIVRPADYMPVKPSVSQQPHVYVIVPKGKSKNMGIAADSLLDIVETTAIEDKKSLVGTGIAGSMIVNNRMTVLLDVDSLLNVVEP